MIAKIKDFVGDVSKEMKKVSWPTRQQLRESTIVVLSACGIITVFVWIVDVAMTALVDLIF